MTREEQRIWILVGTRPEVIKQAPVYLACRERFGPDRVALIGTGQHRELLAQALAHFNLELERNMAVMKAEQTPITTAAAILPAMEEMLTQERPAWIVVQGDTTSAAMAAWASFHAQVPIAHNEAGLRTYDLYQPFPEEANRKLITAVANVHFAPTQHARDALLMERVPTEAIHVTGNPGIDALRMTLSRPVPKLVGGLLIEARQNDRKLVLMTAHRRENQGGRMNEWFAALAAFLADQPDLTLVYPIHPNRMGLEPAERHLRQMPNVILVDPLDYGETCHMLAHCQFAITDSGGIQEEAATLGVPVVVCRRATERPEAVVAGFSQVVGTAADALMAALRWAYELGLKRADREWNPIFGDGRAADRIARVLSEQLA